VKTCENDQTKMVLVNSILKEPLATNAPRQSVVSAITTSHHDLSPLVTWTFSMCRVMCERHWKNGSVGFQPRNVVKCSQNVWPGPDLLRCIYVMNSLCFNMSQRYSKVFFFQLGIRECRIHKVAWGGWISQTFSNVHFLICAAIYFRPLFMMMCSFCFV